MGFIRRFLSVGLGVAAGAAAYKIMKDYNKDGHIEGDFVEVNPVPETAEPAEQAAPQDVPHPEEPIWHAAQGPDAPNVNPVTSTAAPEAPRTADGKIDPTRLASPEDFQDWDSLGCKE